MFLNSSVPHSISALTSLKSSLIFSTSKNVCCWEYSHRKSYRLPLRYSILSEPSSECQVLPWRLSVDLTRGLYSHPDFRSGIHLRYNSLLKDFIKNIFKKNISKYLMKIFHKEYLKIFTHTSCFLNPQLSSSASHTDVRPPSQQTKSHL